MFSNFLLGDFVLIDHFDPLGFNTLTIFETETSKLKCFILKYFCCLWLPKLVHLN